jgi:gamma-glutamyltranspeptidase/glutathione hydrolase
MDGMRKKYLYSTGRPVTMGTQYMVAAPHYLASMAGSAMLEKGGSAVDAIIATNAALAVVYGHMSGLGGDMFAQVWDPGAGKVEALNASGRAGERANPEFFRSQGHKTIPARGPLAAITVPGVVSGWHELHKRYGKLPWRALFQPAIEYAGGFALSPKYADFVASYASTLQPYESTAALFLPGGQPLRAGRVLRQPDLANSFTLIAEGGAEVFYRGELGQRIIEGLQQAGGILTMNDLSSHTSDWVEPLRVNYKGYEITELPPNTQGIATLMILNLLEKFDLAAIGEGSADYYHLMAEAVKLAFADRDRWVTDPSSVDIPVDRLLSKEYANQRSQKIDLRRAAADAQLSPGIDAGDTVYLCAVDSSGQVVSLIQSVYYEFGSAFMAPGTGILLQNRGSFFSLDDQHVNVLAPGKRTFHTIIPAMALKDGKPVMAFGTMGGEGQPQTQAALVTRILDFGLNVQEAIEAPRWLYGRTWGQDSRTLKLEGRIPDGIAYELQRRGHDVEMMQDWSGTMGHAQAIWIDRDHGVLHGGADPRGDGLAIGR